MDDRIDDLRADVGDPRRQHAGNQREQGEHDAQRFGWWSRRAPVRGCRKRIRPTSCVATRFGRPPPTLGQNAVSGRPDGVKGRPPTCYFTRRQEKG